MQTQTATALWVVPVVWIGLALVFGVPLHRILRRAGLSGWWTVLNLLPFVGPMALIGLLAFQDWPHEPEGYR